MRIYCITSCFCNIYFWLYSKYIAHETDDIDFALFVDSHKDIVCSYGARHKLSPLCEPV